MPTGTYAATWRVVSDDGHPVAGTLTFGVGEQAAPGATDLVQAPASVLLTRWIGYLGFALVVGVVVFTSLCAPEGRTDRAVQSLLRWGLVLAGTATVLAVLVQGPYVVGESVLHLTDPSLLTLTFASGIGFWMGWRLVGYLAVAMFAWRLSWLDAATARWPTLGILLGIAATFSRTGHGHATSWSTPYVLTLHVLAAGIWVGGLVLLCVAPRSVSTPALPRFSRLALVTVAVLVASGIVNAVLHLNRVADLWTSRYGEILSTKLGLVLLALLAAAVSRNTLRHRGSPWRSVRVEAALTVTVLAVTAWLSVTSPPPSNQHASSVTRGG
jgi:copper transport protein